MLTNIVIGAITLLCLAELINWITLVGTGGKVKCSLTQAFSLSLCIYIIYYVLTRGLI